METVLSVAKLNNTIKFGFNFQESKRSLNEAVLFALLGYETGYSHIQQTQMEKFLRCLNTVFTHLSFHFCHIYAFFAWRLKLGH